MPGHADPHGAFGVAGANQGVHQHHAHGVEGDHQGPQDHWREGQLAGLRIGQEHRQDGIGQRDQQQAQDNAVNKGEGGAIPSPLGGILLVAPAQGITDQRGRGECYSEGRQNGGDVEGHQDVDGGDFSGADPPDDPDQGNQTGREKQLLQADRQGQPELLPQRAA